MLPVAAVAFAFYAPSLQFGFFNDDPTGHFHWMEGRSAWSLLTDASGHGYYRPVSFILWQILYMALGRHDPFVLHLLNVLAHAANAALVAWLTRRLTGRLGYAALAGALFALYPFSYEAVPYVGSFVHPLATLLILLTLALYVHWREDGARWAFAAAHVTLVLAVFTQENAVITPLLILALGLLNLVKARSVKPSQGYSLSFFIEPVAFAIVWLLVPKTAEARTFDLAAIRANLLPFVQALVYPVAPLANHSPTTLAILAAISIAVLFALANYAHAIRPFVFGLLVWALASLPSIVILDNTYVLGSPRLFYLASVGAAMIWPIPVLGLWTRSRNWMIEAGTVAAMLAVCYLPSSGYMRCELAYQGLAGEIGQMMADAARSTPPGQEVTFINLPYFFSSRGQGTECRNPFVFAPTGAVAIPPYADPRDFVRYNGGPDIPTFAFAVREYQPGWSTFGSDVSVEQLRQRLAATRVFVFDLIRWQLFDLSAAWQPGAPPQPAQVTLDGAQISNFKYQTSNARAVVTLIWQSATPVQGRKVFVHVYDSSGKLAAQDDGIPAEGFVPTSWWRAGDVITDTHVVGLDGLPPGTYHVMAGMYDAVTDARVQAHGMDGTRLPDDEVPVAEINKQGG